MIDKEKQIAEMAKDIFNCNDALEGIDFVFGHGKGTHFDRIAKKLTAIGYRKISEDAVVFTKEEYDEIKYALEVSRAYMVKEAYRIEQASKKIARDILEKIKELGVYADENRYIDCLCVQDLEIFLKEKYGVEV